MNYFGFVTNKTSGIFVRIPDLRAEYGPLSYVGEAGEYAIGDKVLVCGLGADEYIVVGVIHP